jgi:hypothetical protein
MMHGGKNLHLRHSEISSLYHNLQSMQAKGTLKQNPRLLKVTDLSTKEKSHSSKEWLFFLRVAVIFDFFQEKFYPEA